jgi:hypothetical protein
VDLPLDLSVMSALALCSKRAKNLRREHGKVWKRLNQIEDKPRQDQLQELRNEVHWYNCGVDD